MNHNEINRQCAEAMGLCAHRNRYWEDWENPYGYDSGSTEKCRDCYIVGTDRLDATISNFCTDWNAMKVLVEYANERDFALCLSEQWKGICVAEFISRKVNGGYFCDDADTFSEAAALAFRKCFGKDG